MKEYEEIVFEFAYHEEKTNREKCKAWNGMSTGKETRDENQQAMF